MKIALIGNGAIAKLVTAFCAERKDRFQIVGAIGLPENDKTSVGAHPLMYDYQQLLGDLKGLEIGTLHVERNEDSGDEELAYVPGNPEEDPLFRCLRGELEERLTEAISKLPDRERLVMTLYYYEEMTMREIGLALGVVESRVSQVHASAVARLRASLKDLASKGVFEKKRKKPRFAEK